MTLKLEPQQAVLLARELVGVGLAEQLGFGYLQFDPALMGEISAEERVAARSEPVTHHPRGSYELPRSCRRGSQGPVISCLLRIILPIKEPTMSLTTALIVNALAATAVVATLAYICRIPFRLDRLARREELSLEREQLAYEQTAA